MNNWLKQKNEIISDRLKGFSYSELCIKYRISKSSLHYLISGLKLSDKAKKNIAIKKRNSILIAGTKATKVHALNRIKRDIEARESAEDLIENLPTSLPLLELALSMLYWGEGTKGNRFAIGNSDPVLLSFFIKCLEKLYGKKRDSFKPELHLRVDQDVYGEKLYWSKALKIPVNNFNSVIKDKRTAGTKTYENYHGVCVVGVAGIAVQRKIMYIYKLYSQKIISGS